MRADRGGKRLGKPAQDEVAGLVAPRVVDLLEVVDVEGDHTEGRAGPFGALRLSPELGHEAAAVRQRGELVGERLLLDEPVQVRVLERDLGLGRNPFRRVAGVVVEGLGAAVEAQHGGRPRLGAKRHVELLGAVPVRRRHGSCAERRS